jgi:hypothetical protein
VQKKCRIVCARNRVVTEPLVEAGVPQIVFEGLSESVGCASSSKASDEDFVATEVCMPRSCSCPLADEVPCRVSFERHQMLSGFAARFTSSASHLKSSGFSRHPPAPASRTHRANSDAVPHRRIQPRSDHIR